MQGWFRIFRKKIFPSTFLDYILKSYFTILSITFLPLITGCGITQPVRPLEEGATEAIASFGGPVVPVGGISFPIPYLNLGVMHGYTSDLTLYGNAHVTALLFKDVGLDGGAAVRIFGEEKFRPELTFNGRIYFFWDAFRGNTSRLYPMGTLTASYSTGERSLFYFGVDNLYQFQPSGLFVSPFIGYQFPVSNVMQLQIESKWMAMNQDTRHGVFEGGGSIGGKGNIGVFVGLQYEIAK